LHSHTEDILRAQLYSPVLPTFTLYPENVQNAYKNSMRAGPADRRR